MSEAELWAEIKRLKSQVAELATRERKRNIGSRVYRSTSQTLTTGAPAAISFDTERYDLGGFWVVGSPTRLTVPVTGRYLITACAAFASNATGVRNIDLRIGGATVIGSQLQVAASGIITIVSVATVYEIAASDYVEMICFQNSLGNLNVNSTGNYTPEMAIDYLGPMT